MPVGQPGQVILLDDTRIGHPKYLLVAGVPAGGDHPLLFYISSRLYPYIQTRAHLWPFQIKVDRQRHPFMPKEESWMNCTQVCIDHLWVSIEYMLANQLGGICGMIHYDVRAQVIAAVKDQANEGISKKHRDIILGCL